MAEEIEKILNDDEQLKAVAKQAFDAVDTDGSGSISASELHAALNGFAAETGVQGPNEEQTLQVLKAVDKDESGALSLDEFCELIKAVLNEIKEALG